MTLCILQTFIVLQAVCWAQNYLEQGKLNQGPGIICTNKYTNNNNLMEFLLG